MPDPPTAKPPRWGFLGAGKMATALVRGMIAAGAAAPSSIRAGDPLASARSALAESCGIVVCDSNHDVLECSDVIVLAVKPQNMDELLAELQPDIRPDHLVISIAAGVTLDRIASFLGPDCRLARVMPNTPALIGAGASGFCLGPNTTIEDERTVRSCLDSVGRAVRVPESMLDGVTGLSGSGPAFVYLMIEALSDGGVRIGLPRDIATLLAAQTVAGAARMVLETGLHPGQLKDQVTSPGGTTIAGLHALERGGLRAALMDAVEAATLRSRELAEPS